MQIFLFCDCEQFKTVPFGVQDVCNRYIKRWRAPGLCLSDVLNQKNQNGSYGSNMQNMKGDNYKNMLPFHAFPIFWDYPGYMTFKQDGMTYHSAVMVCPYLGQKYPSPRTGEPVQLGDIFTRFNALQPHIIGVSARYWASWPPAHNTKTKRVKSSMLFAHWPG